MTPELLQIRHQCETNPAYRSGSAYGRTKIVCKAMSEAGISIPGWAALREVIERGSATDINKGIKDYRDDLSKLLRLFGGGALSMPPALARQVEGLWVEAVAAAREGLKDDVEQWLQQVEVAQAALQATVAERDAAKSVVMEGVAEIERLKGWLSTANTRSEAEKEARVQLAILYEQQASELRVHRQRLEGMVREAAQEREAALKRLEGAQQHALMQIEEARSQAKRDLAALQAQRQRDRSATEMDLARVRNRVEEERSRRGHAEQEAVVANNLNVALQDRLARAEKQADELASAAAKAAALLGADRDRQARTRKLQPARPRARTLNKGR